jgi:hypothetical protein
MSDDQHNRQGPPPGPPGGAPAPPAGEGATQLFNLKLDSWLTDFVADLNAPAGAPPVGLEGTPMAGPPAAPPEDPYRAAGPGPAAPFAGPAAPFAGPAAPFAGAAAPFAGAAAPHQGSSPDAFGGPSPMRSRSSPDAFGGPSPLAGAPLGQQASDPYAAPPPPQDPSATSGIHAASAVPPIPAFAASAVPPIPGLAGGAPQFQEPRRRWPIVLALVMVLVAAAGGGAWFFFGARLRALLAI